MASNGFGNNNGSCAICLSSAHKKCGNCKITFYCSVEHQKKDWKHHKSICDDLSAGVIEDVDVKYAGVKINCNGDRATSGVFLPVSVPANDPIYTTAGQVCPVSVKIGIPLLVRYCPSKETPFFERAELDNQPTTYMMMDPVTGVAPPSWQSNVGTTVFVRQDRKPLKQHHLEAIWQFHSHLLDLFGKADPTEASRKMNKEDFLVFWESFKSGQLEKNLLRDLLNGSNNNNPGNWAYTGSPFDI